MLCKPLFGWLIIIQQRRFIAAFEPCLASARSMPVMMHALGGFTRCRLHSITQWSGSISHARANWNGHSLTDEPRRQMCVCNLMEQTLRESTWKALNVLTALRCYIWQLHSNIHNQIDIYQQWYHVECTYNAVLNKGTASWWYMA